MARPTTISDEKILQVARAVFLEHGIAATTADVARKAGVAEGSIFKRWKTKQELFYAAMKTSTEEPAFMRDLAQRVGRGDLCETLTEMATLGIEFFKQLLPMAMMMWSNPSTNGLPVHLDVPNSGPVRALKKLAAYFEAEMAAGRMARRDPEVLARTFLGAIQHYAFLEVLGLRAELPLPAPMFVRGLVHVIWNGVRPEPAPRTRKRSKEKSR